MTVTPPFVDGQVLTAAQLNQLQVAGDAVAASTVTGITAGTGITVTYGSGIVTIAASGAGAGTVTSFAFTNANGFTGSVLNSTTTPTLTVGTSLTGLLKGNGTAMSAATSGTDYSAGTSGLGTGIVKTTTGTGALTIAVAGDFPTLNQNTTGTAAGLSATLAIASGGTNSTGTPTAGGVAYGTGTAYAVTAAKTTGTVWLSGGAGAPTTTTGTLALAGNLATVGAFASTFTMTGVTGVTFPTSGTLLSTAAAVTVAQGGTGLATLTSGSLIVGAGTSNPTFLAPGSNGNVAVVAGGVWTSAPPAAGSSGWTLLSTVTAASSATVDVDTTFSSTYDAYVIVFSGITVATDSVQMLMQMKLGGSYVTTSYVYHTTENLSSSATYAAVNSTGTSSIEVLRLLRNSADASANLEVWIFNPSSTAFNKLTSFKGNSVNPAAGVVTSISGAGACLNTAALTGVRFLASSGNIAAGKARLYGISNT